MRPAIKWGAGALIVAGLAAAATPWVQWNETVRDRLARQVLDSTGLELNTRERVTVALLPRPHVKLRAVRVRDRWRKLNMDVQILKGDLKLLPLLAGRMEVANLSLILPTISFDIEARPLIESGARARANAAVEPSPDKARSDAPPLGSISIVGGRILLRSGSQQPVTQIGDINATLNWRTIDAPAHFDGSFIWRGEKVALRTSVGKPGDVLRGQTSPLVVDLKTRLLHLALNGNLLGGAGWQYQGRITSSSDALRSLLSVSGADLPLPGPLTSASLQADLNFRPGSFSLSRMTLQLDNNKFAGALAVHTRDERPMISGTLATEQLTIDPRASRFPTPTTDNGQWNHEALPLKALRLVDIDLRLSAQDARIGHLRASEVALVALSRQGNLEVTASSLQSYGGRFRTRLNIEQGPALPALAGSLQFENINTAQLLRHTTRRTRISGLASGEIALRSAGSNYAEIVELLSGDINIRLTNGEMAGIDIPEGLRLARTLPLSIPDRLRTGSTAFKEAMAVASIKDGALSLTEAKLDGGAFHCKIGGKIHLPERRFELSLTAKQRARSAASDPEPDQLDLSIVGDWDRPAIIPNPESLILRSKAAEPLLRTIERVRGLAQQPSGSE